MVTQAPARRGSGDVKNVAEKEAQESRQRTPASTKEAKAEGKKATEAAAGVEPKEPRERGSADESAPAAETQETRPMTRPAENAPSSAVGTAVGQTAATEVDIRKQAAQLADSAADAPTPETAPELPALYFSEYAELSRAIGAAIATFEARMTPDASLIAAGFDQPQPPRGMKSSLQKIKAAHEELAQRIHTPEEQHKGQDKDRYDREIVE